MRRQAAYFGVLTALALIFSYVETFIPVPIGIPGIKIGLANLVVVIALYKMDILSAYILAVLRVVLAGFLFGNLFSILYSLAGSLLSVSVMFLLKKTGLFSVVGISFGGGVAHNLGQLLVAAVVVESYNVFYYVPVLIIAGLLTGAAIWICSQRDAETAAEVFNIIWQVFIGAAYTIARNENRRKRMISYIRGTLAEIEEDRILVDVGGIGYGIYMPGESITRLPGVGTEIKIHTYLNVREDAMQLFGFLTKDDLRVFRLVIGVSGIGPKGGLNILSCLSPDDLRFAVMAGDAKAISKAPGIGKKTAEKLIIELKDKLSIEDTLSRLGDSKEENMAVSSGISEIQSEAVQALTALGYAASEAAKAVKLAAPSPQDSVEDVLKAALKQMISL